MARLRHQARRRQVIEINSMPGAPDAATVARLSVLIPNDRLRARRLRNIAAASQLVVALNGDAPMGVVYVRRIACVPNVTWLVAESARRQGLAVRMLATLQRDYSWLTAICRNDASVGLAKRAGFRMAGPFALWVRTSSTRH